MSGITAKQDETLVRRIIEAYNFSSDRFQSHGSAIWQHIGKMTTDVAGNLQRRDFEAVRKDLQFPHTNNLFYGFENLAKAIVGSPPLPYSEVAAKKIHELLIGVAAATGCIRLFNPEQPDKLKTPNDTSIGALLPALDSRLGYRLEFPNPYPHETGLETSRGLASYRALQACYQAWRISTVLDGKRDPSVLEIGAGLGRNAYYAHKSGITDYTIIDLPMSNVAQGYFLGRVLGPDSVTLSGENERREHKVRVFDTLWRPAPGERFDVAINVDSFSEMNQETAADYLEMIRKHCDVFISINHEHNPFTVASLLDKMGLRSNRYPYWIRPGYVEEVVRFDRR
jgi:hypothetical protein